LGKLSPIICADDLVIGWKVAKDWPIWSLDVNAWNKYVIEIDNKEARLNEHLSPKDYLDDDNTSREYTDVDDGSNEGNKTKHNTEHGEQTLQEKKEDEDDDNYVSENEGDYELSSNNSCEDDKETSQNEPSEDDNVELSSDDSSLKFSSIDGSDGLHNVNSNMKKDSNKNTFANIKEFNTSGVTNDNDMKPEAKNRTKSLQHNKSNVPDITFNDLFSGDLKQEVAENVKKMTNLNKVPIYITGPFRNDKTCKSYWVVIYGDCGTAWMVKSLFIRGYLAQLLSCHGSSNIDSNHCHTYEDINIRKEEFGVESVWKRTPSTNKLVNRVCFVYSCNTANEITEKQGIIESVKFYPVGPMVLEHLKNHIDGLYKYFMRGKPSEDSVGTSLTKDIDKFCQRGFNIIWSDSLNNCMVDYDITRILKTYGGYNNWDDVPIKQKQLCYHSFDKNFNLPDWDTEQEKY
jgi:hypothetical protein